MNEIENIKAGLTYLLDINDLKNNVTVTKDGKSHSMNVKDLKEANYDVLLQIAELLGMDVNNQENRILEENHDLEKIIEDAKQYRWYSVPDMYVVEILDTTGCSAGFVQSIFIDKKEASEVAKVLHGVVREVVGG